MLLAKNWIEGYPSIIMEVRVLKNLSEPSEEERVQKLVSRVRNGDRNAFDQIFELYHRKIFNLALRLLGDFDEASDQTQEIFVKLYQKIDQFQGRSKFFTWFYTLALNSCRNRLASTKSRRTRETPFPEDEHSRERMEIKNQDDSSKPDNIAEVRERASEVHEVLGRLDETFRVILVLRDIQGLSYEEISQVLQLSLGTVKSRISRAREMLRKEWVEFTGRRS
ncbi:sigma-70 family RNA polymerase sigma factor [bacterium]|jgi:RNA polymerase sigma-70 factor, ECF subfamily|nr:sigma-70 family RNA polymerase sigma factor [bacterium]